MTFSPFDAAKDYWSHLTEEGRPSLAALQTWIDQTGSDDFHRLHQIIESGVAKSSPLTLLRRVGIMPTASQVAKAAAARHKEALLPELVRGVGMLGRGVGAIGRGIGAFGGEAGSLAANLSRGVSTSPAVAETVQNVKNVGHGVAESVRGYHGQLLDKLHEFNTPQLKDLHTGEIITDPLTVEHYQYYRNPFTDYDMVTPAEQLGKKLGPAAVGAGAAGLGAGGYEAAKGLHHLLGGQTASQVASNAHAAAPDAANFL
jgi:hypothetical protein